MFGLLIMFTITFVLCIYNVNKIVFVASEAVAFGALGLLIARKVNEVSHAKKVKLHTYIISVITSAILYSTIVNLLEYACLFMRMGSNASWEGHPGYIQLLVDVFLVTPNAEIIRWITVPILQIMVFYFVDIMLFNKKACENDTALKQIEEVKLVNIHPIHKIKDSSHMENEKTVIVDENGKEIKFEIYYKFISEEYGNFLFYINQSESEENYKKIYVSLFELPSGEDESVDLLPVKRRKDLWIAKSLVNAMQEEVSIEDIFDEEEIEIAEIGQLLKESKNDDVDDDNHE